MKPIMFDGKTYFSYEDVDLRMKEIARLAITGMMQTQLEASDLFLEAILQEAETPDTWEKTDADLELMYKRWRELAEEQPSQKDVVNWNRWDAIMQREVRDPCTAIFERRILLLEQRYARNQKS